MVDPSFELGENHFLAGQYSWRFKDGELRYRGDGEFADLVLGRIPVDERQIQRFISVLDLLDVWRWRDDYDPEDVGAIVEDGSTWWFKAKLGERECICGGCNAFPSYSDAAQTSLNPERFALLNAGLYDVYSIDSYIKQAEMFGQLERRRRTSG